MQRFTFLLFLFAHIMVHGKFKVVPQNQTVLQGETVWLNCSLYPSSYQKIKQWKAGRQLLGIHEPGILPGNDRRYYYISDSPEELNLLIQNVQITDDGEFECQMVVNDVKPVAFRALASVNVIVPPQGIRLLMENLTLEVDKPDFSITMDDGGWLNITCVGEAAKPKVDVKWYADGTYVTGAALWHIQNENNTITSFSGLEWNIGKLDHNKTLECIVIHRETLKTLRFSFKLYVSELLKPETTPTANSVPTILTAEEIMNSSTSSKISLTEPEILLSSEIYNTAPIAAIQPQMLNGSEKNWIIECFGSYESTCNIPWYVWIILGAIIFLFIIGAVTCCIYICIERQKCDHIEENDIMNKFNTYDGNIYPVSFYGLDHKRSLCRQKRTLSQPHALSSYDEEIGLPSPSTVKEDGKFLEITNLNPTSVTNSQQGFYAYVPEVEDEAQGV